MSLILEALRKLEREKPAPDRGVVVMTTAGLGGERRGWPPWAWLAGGLVAGVVAAFAAIELRSPAVPIVPARAPVAVPAATVPPATVPASAAPLVPSPAAYVSKPLPRATSPSTTVPAPKPADSLVLQAITSQDGRPVALINDRVLREGDEWDGLRIVRIGEAEVEVERNGVRSVLRF